MTVEIELTRGYKAIVDDEDADLGIHKWRVIISKKNNCYAQCSGGIKIHRIILSRILERELQKSEFCDHINCDGLDNRRANLRVATPRQNARNRRIGKNNTTGYKNVVKRSNKFVAQVRITSFGRKTILCRFANIIEAAKIADLIVARLHGEFANLNFPRPIRHHEIKMSKAIEAISDLYPICSQSKFIPRAKDD